MLENDIASVEIVKLRRFALAVGLVLLTYTLAGVHLDSPARVTPLGIPLVINRPDLLGLGLVLASIYGGVRYWYYSMVINVSPTHARRRLLQGKLARGEAAGIEPAEFARRAFAELRRYFPRLGDHVTVMPYTIKIEKIPAATRFLVVLEDVDYTAPIWLNVVALGVYLGRGDMGIWMWRAVGRLLG